MALIVDAEGKLQSRMLKLDRAMGDKWLVATGLSLGDRLIVEGLQKVQRMPPGTPVKSVHFSAAETKRTVPKNSTKPAASN
jgi:membrane fusion protein (multidrug efflux system)